MPANTYVPAEMGFSGAGVSSFAGSAPLEQLVRQESHLGFIRELTPPDNHIGTTLLAPWHDVPTDDVIFDYLKSSGSGLAPAVAQDAESKLFRDVDDITGQMRASLMDWRLKSRYASSDVMTFRDAISTAETLKGAGASLPLYVTNILDGFRSKVDRDTAKRRLWLDNRIEWLNLTAISTGKIAYNDGEIKFNVDFKRPVNQHAQAPKSTLDYSVNGGDHDPINDIIDVKQKMFDLYGVEIDRAICSRKFLNSLYKTKKFATLSGFAPSANVDLKYGAVGWGPQSAIDIIQRETEITFIPYDNVFRARNVTDGTVSNQRFLAQNQVIFLPSEEGVNLTDNTEIGFAKTLTSPHPMGNFTTGFYSWESNDTDPWQYVIGSGVKAFPVYPHMDLTYTWENLVL